MLNNVIDDHQVFHCLLSRFFYASQIGRAFDASWDVIEDGVLLTAIIHQLPLDSVMLLCSLLQA